MGIQERREREKQELRLKILKAARELFAKRGYEAVTMREIARRIEYSATALYGHFPDKETLFNELCRQDFAEFAQGFLRGVAGAGDPVERLCHAALVYLSFAEHYPEHYRLMFLAEHPDVTPTEEERNDPTQNAYVFLRALVTELCASGLLRPELTDVDLIAQTVWAGVHGAAALDLTMRQQAPWLDVKPRSERFAASLELILRGLVKNPDEQLQKLRRALGKADEVSAAQASNAAPTRQPRAARGRQTGTSARGALRARGSQRPGARQKPRG